LFYTHVYYTLTGGTAEITPTNPPVQELTALALIHRPAVIALAQVQVEVLKVTSMGYNAITKELDKFFETLNCGPVMIDITSVSSCTESIWSGFLVKLIDMLKAIRLVGMANE
jgi:hypothetical protein